MLSKITRVLLILLFLFACVVAISLFSNPADLLANEVVVVSERSPAEKIEPGLRDAVAASGYGSYWVDMAAQADLSAAYGITDWSARGWYVYDTLRETAASSQAELMAQLAGWQQAGAVQEYRSYFINNAILVTSDVATLDAIATRPEVGGLRAPVSYPVPEIIPENSPPGIEAIEWGVNRIGSPQIWTEFGTTGEGIIVANIDTGVAYTHAALVNQYRGNLGGSFNHSYNWYDPTGLCSGSAPCDQNNHGTHTMGTIAGNDGGSNQIGNAPGARWIAARGCESNFCSDFALTASWEWMVAPCALGDDPGDPSCDPDQRPNVLNYSIGGPGGDPSDQPEINAARAAGIVLSISAGNSGPGSNTVGSPGDYCNVIGVGATDINDNIASFSSRGPGNFNCGDPQMRKPDVSAPGVNVRSSIANGGYGNFNGTSMAAPHVTGCAALLLGIDPSLTHDDIFVALTTTAVDLGSAGFDFAFGYGRIDCYAAAQSLGPPGPTPTPIPPTPTPAPGSTVHVGDLDGSSTPIGSRWSAHVTISVHDGNEAPVSGATVNGSWSNGSSGSGSCITDGSGQCTITQNNIRSNFASVDFTVTTVSSAGYTYDGAANHDPDGDSNGTDITVFQAGPPPPTPTPPPPTPTPDPSATVHVGDLDGSSTPLGNRWTANVVITVHDNNDNPVANADVSGSWSNGANGNSNCTTNTIGQCTVTKSLRTLFSSVTFSVTNVTANGFTYGANANHDPDGDSDGTVIVVFQ